MSSSTFLVTGASTGIGAATVRRLSLAGHTVYAGVRKEEDAAKARSWGCRPVQLDVTVPEQVRAVAERVGDLDGLVLNAGISENGPLEFLPTDILRRCLEVNTLGAMEVTQACLPGLRARRGRLVFVSSIAGRLALPLTGPYSASKFALEALADALRRELRPDGMRVVLIEPGAVHTPIIDKTYAYAEQTLPGLPDQARQIYGPRVDRLLGFVRRAEATALPADVVAERIERALTLARPPARMLVGNDAKLQAWLAMCLPAWALDAVIERVLGGR